MINRRMDESKSTPFDSSILKVKTNSRCYYTGRKGILAMKMRGNWALSARHLVKEYNKDITAINDISLDLYKNMFYAITGPSGAGKSTLLHILGLLDRPTSGTLLIGDKVCNRLNDNQRAFIRCNTLGFVFQSCHLNPRMRAYENVMLPMYICHKNHENMKTRAIRLLYQVGLGDRIEHFPCELSAGEQQRVAIARALANDPDCILADEPTGNLDEKNQNMIFDIFKSLSDQGKCVAVVSHSPYILKYAQDEIRLRGGSLLY